MRPLYSSQTTHLESSSCSTSPLPEGMVGAESSFGRWPPMDLLAGRLLLAAWYAAKEAERGHRRISPESGPVI